MARPVQVALLGYGLAGSRFHAPFISTTAGMRLSTVVTGDDERREQAVREHPRVEVVGTADEVWERAAELDLAVIATPNESHLPLGLAALEAGLAVVVDKPLALNAAEARSLVEAAAERGLMLSAFQNRRWDRCRMVVENSARLGEIEMTGGDKEEHSRLMGQSLMALAQPI